MIKDSKVCPLMRLRTVISNNLLFWVHLVPRGATETYQAQELCRHFEM